jgi:hypothetical protein
MGRRFLLRPLEKHVNGEINFPRISTLAQNIPTGSVNTSDVILEKEAVMVARGGSIPRWNEILPTSHHPIEKS